ncbi:hypothetical protein KGC99_002546 [Enterococcus hirae]|nr:hypothetical protein [Enterococcus hirae]
MPAIKYSEIGDKIREKYERETLKVISGKIDIDDARKKSVTIAQSLNKNVAVVKDSISILHRE